MLHPEHHLQRDIMTKREVEQQVVDDYRELIAFYEGKIKGVIDKVWG